MRKRTEVKKMYKNFELEDYKDIRFSERRELDQKAYEKYYAEQYDKHPYTYNRFYGTETHKKYLIPFLRKAKLEQIKKVSN